MAGLLFVLGLGLGLGVPADSTYRGDRGELEVRVPRVEVAGVRVDGRLDEAVWGEAAVLSGFTQFAPAEGAPASQRTEVRVAYGPEAIYFGVEAFDTEPARIRASLTQRDEGVTEDDWVRIILDTFDDNAQAYVFYVNPRGIQADGLWVVGGESRFGPPIDFNPDFLWESAGRVTERGWEAEIRVPYPSLRFRNAPEQTWGLNVVRQVQRAEYQSSWAPITADAANTLELSGRLVGLEGLESRRLVELNPVATGKRTGERVDGRFEREGFEPAVGLNARYGLSRNLVLDATLNPDFSQVEADADEIVVNERFAIFFPEKRPFFLEGTEVFSTPERLVYTRAIVDPLGGAKVTGKVGRTSVGYLGALDESPLTLGDGDREALFNLVRARRDVGTGSTVGALYTDRTLVDGSRYNRVGALDARLVVGGRYTVTAQLGGSWSREGGGPGGRAAEGGDLFGSLLSARIERSGRSFGWSAGLVDVHPEFRARSGFIRRTGDAEVRGALRYTFVREAGSFLEDWGPQLEANAFFDHEDLWAGRRFEEAEVAAALDVSLRGPNGFNLAITNGYFSFDPDDYGAYAVSGAAPGGPGRFDVPGPLDNLVGVRLFSRARPLPWLSLGLTGSYGEVPIFAEASRGVELQLSPTATLRFPWGLFADLSYTVSQIDRSTGSRFSDARIPRVRVQYQLMRALFARAIVQYNLQDRDALRSPAGEPLLVEGVPSLPEAGGELQYDLLLSYEPSPGTILYAGWSRIREGPRTYRFGELTPTAAGLFVKVSYLLRL